MVKQEKPEKADQNPEHRAENGEPEWDVPARVGDIIKFCLGHTSWCPRWLLATRGNPRARSVSALRFPVTRKPWSL
jgi:hypothetical protein